MTLASITLIVTSLLVVSPIIFLISAAPNMPKQCDECFEVPPPECQEDVCKSIASSIQAKIDWNIDFCSDFKSFSCSANQQHSLRIVKTPQEIADNQMLRKLISLSSQPYYRMKWAQFRDDHQFSFLKHTTAAFASRSQFIVFCLQFFPGHNPFHTFTWILSLCAVGIAANCQ